MNRVFAGMIVGLSAVLGAQDARAAFNVNLLTSGDAESGTYVGNVGGFSIVSTPGWTNVAGNFEAELYSEGVPPNTNPNSPGPANRGSLPFYGGIAAMSIASQTIGVASDATTIDAGIAATNLSGYLGGYSTDDDNAIFSATYLGANGNFLEQLAIGPVLAADRGEVSGLLYRSDLGLVPVGTRSIVATLTITRTNGSFNNGAADNLSLSLTVVPEPSSVLLCGIAAAAGLLAAGRRRPGRVAG